MKKFTIIVTVMILALIMVGCPNGTPDEREVYEDALRDIYGVMGVPDFAEDIISAAFGQQEDNRATTTSEPTTTPISDINLNLPLVVQENTFCPRTSSHNGLRISLDGTLHRLNHNGEVTESIDIDVRSFARIPSGVFREAIIYIKSDHTLWGIGSNDGGLLGDGTGVDKTESIKIMNDVATIHVIHNVPYVIKIDRTLWTWGNGAFSPVQISSDVINVFPNLSGLGTSVNIQTSTGYIYDLAYKQWVAGAVNLLSEQTLTRLLPIPVYSGLSNESIINRLPTSWVWIPFINAERELIRQNVRYSYSFMPPTPVRTSFGESEIIASDVKDVFITYSTGTEHIFFIKTDDSLWGMGVNSNGELGDGTKVPRNEPVHIADNIAQLGLFYFLKQNGTLWAWSENNPTPRQLFDNVAKVINSVIHFNDGSVLVNPTADISWWCRHGSRENWLEQVDNIKVPSTIMFD